MNHKLQVIAISVFVFSAAAWGQQDPLVGTWKLNLAKSTFSPGQPPRSSRLKYEQFGEVLKLTIETVNAQGQQTGGPSLYVFDGKDYGIAFTSISYVNRRIDSHTTERVIKKDGNPLVTTRRVVSRDGKTMTVTHTGKTEAGEPINNVQVYDKQ